MNKKFFFQKFTNLVKINLNKISFLIFLLFFAFICGNVFGIYSKTADNISLFLFITIINIEFISFLKYKKKCQSLEQELINSNFFTKFINVLKRGFLIGLFVEAFKVGS